MTNEVGYSSTVSGCLVAGEHKFILKQLGPDFCILRDPIDLGPTDAVMHITVDDNLRTCPVYLKDGISRQSELTRYTNAGLALS